jgi:acetyltransferase-like isoleucine patch superfamily enzyme
MVATMPRKLEWDWHDGLIPDNVWIDPAAYVETSQSFELYCSELAEGARIEAGAAIYPPTMLDLGVHAQLVLGECAMLNGPRIICDGRIEIGAYSLISWNVVLMDTYRVPIQPEARRELLRKGGRLDAGGIPREIHIGKNVWIGFDAIVLPGVSIGEGSVIGARSVVAQDIPAYCIAAGSPARVVKKLR